MVKNNIVKIIRYSIYGILGILVFIFNNQIPNCLGYVVGGVMLLYGIEGLIFDFKKSSIITKGTRFFTHLILVIMSFITMFIAKDDIKLVCYIWAVWSIDREAEEIDEKVLDHLENIPVAIINGLESLIVMGLSIMLIINPLEHMHSHIILLGIELLLEVVWNVIIDIQEKKKEK